MSPFERLVLRALLALIQVNARTVVGLRAVQPLLDDIDAHLKKGDDPCQN